MNKHEMKNQNSGLNSLELNSATYEAAHRLSVSTHIKKVKPMKTEGYKPKTTGLSCIPLGKDLI